MKIELGSGQRPVSRFPPSGHAARLSAPEAAANAIVHRFVSRSAAIPRGQHALIPAPARTGGQVRRPGRRSRTGPLLRPLGVRLRVLADGSRPPMSHPGRDPLRKAADDPQLRWSRVRAPPAPLRSDFLGADLDQSPFMHRFCGPSDREDRPSACGRGPGSCSGIGSWRPSSDLGGRRQLGRTGLRRR